MKDFIEKWKTDSKYKAKIKLILYTLFVVFVFIFATMTNSNTDLDENNNFKDNINATNTTIEIPTNYKYTTNVQINNQNYTYVGEKELNRTSITKISNEVTTNYIYENNFYYKEEDGQYIVTTKEDIFDTINPNYLQLETINEYLKHGTKQNNSYVVYLKDIILGNESEDYLTITIEEKNINIDYTSLMKSFNSQIEKYLVEIKIEENE